MNKKYGKVQLIVAGIVVVFSMSCAGASVIDNNMHDAMKVGKVEMCLQIALDKLRQETTGCNRQETDLWQSDHEGDV